MDVTFDVVGGRPFTMTVGISDTVLEMKEKIEKDKGILVSYQLFAFGGDVLLDDNLSAESCGIGPGSHVLLYIMDQYQPPPPPQPQSQPQFHPRITAELTVTVPRTYSSDSFKVDLTDCVLPLKQTLYQIYGFPTDMLGLYVDGMGELMGDKPIYEYGVSEGSVIEVFIRPPPLASSPSASNTNSTLLAPSSSASRNVPSLLPSCSSGSNKLRVQVLTPSKMRANFDVDPTDKVLVLREELETLQRMLNLELSPDGYRFMHKGIPMYEKESFLWHEVHQGDEIQIVNERVSYASATKMRIRRDKILNRTVRGGSKTN